MDSIAELAFELLRGMVRMFVSLLARIPDIVRVLGHFICDVVVDVLFDAIVDACGRTGRRIHGLARKIPGPSWLAVPISILLILATIVGAFILIVMVGQAILL